MVTWTEMFLLLIKKWLYGILHLKNSYTNWDCAKFEFVERGGGHGMATWFLLGVGQMTTFDNEGGGGTPSKFPKIWPRGIWMTPYWWCAMLETENWLTKNCIQLSYFFCRVTLKIKDQELLWTTWSSIYSKTFLLYNYAKIM